MTEEISSDYCGSGDLSRQEFLRRMGVVVVGTAAALQPSAAFAALAQQPTRGGTLTVGASAGSAKDSIDPHSPLATIDQFRVGQLYEGITRYDANFNQRPLLADEITLERADRLLVRLRQGVEFHTGKPVTADDLLFSYHRIQTQPRAIGRPALSQIDLKRSKKLDQRTVRFVLKEPNVSILDELGQKYAGIVPVGFNPAKPDGTGPFMFQSFDPGRQSVFVRNPNYWLKGLPYLDSLVINDLTDDTARVNALLGGQVDVIDGLPATQVRVVSARHDLALVRSPSGQWAPFYVRVDQSPFNDVRVRQALRLVVDRPQMIRQALAGVGEIGNDVPSPQDPLSNHSLPQRQQDIDKARSLLKQAGQTGLTVTLVTSPVQQGLLEASQVLAEQAKRAGMKINLKQVDTGTLVGPQFLKWLFSVDFWSTRNYLPTVALALLPTSPYDETHWPDPESRARYVQLYNEAKSTVDTAKRRELIHEMQRIDWERGGYLIWSFATFIDAHSTKVGGLLPNKYKPLNGYDMRTVYKT